MYLRRRVAGLWIAMKKQVLEGFGCCKTSVGVPFEQAIKQV